MFKGISRRGFVKGAGTFPALAGTTGPASFTAGFVEKAVEPSSALANLYVPGGTSSIDHLGVVAAAHLFPQVYEKFDLRLCATATASCWAVSESRDSAALVDSHSFVDSISSGSKLISVAQLTNGWPYHIACRQSDRSEGVRALDGARLLVNGERERRAFEELCSRFSIRNSAMVDVRRTTVDDLLSLRGDAALVSDLAKAELATDRREVRFLEVDVLSKYPRSCLVVHPDALKSRGFSGALNRIILTLNAGMAFVQERLRAGVKLSADGTPCYPSSTRGLMEIAASDALRQARQPMGTRVSFGRHAVDQWSLMLRHWNIDRHLNDVITDAHLPVWDRGFTDGARRLARKSDPAIVIT